MITVSASLHYSRVSNNSLYHIVVQLGKFLEKNKRPESNSRPGGKKCHELLNKNCHLFNNRPAGKKIH